MDNAYGVSGFKRCTYLLRPLEPATDGRRTLTSENLAQGFTFNELHRYGVYPVETV